MRSAQASHNVDAGTIGQLQVNQNHVRTHQVSATYGVRNGAGFSDDLQGVIPVNDLSYTTSNDLMIVDDHYARTRGSIFTHEFILTVRRVRTLVYLFFFRGKPIHRVLCGRVLRMLLRRGLA